jgi:hypothetical protein
MKTKYVRLLSYGNAVRLVDFVNKNKEDYAYITVGGVGVQSSDNWNNIIKFLDNLGVTYEINDEPPHKTTEKIIAKLKNDKIID